MKKGFVMMISGLILLATPLLAAAHDTNHRDNDRLGYRQQPVIERHHELQRQAPPARWEQRQVKQMNKHWQMQQRENRHYVRQYRPDYILRPVVIAGLPSLIFHIGW